MPRNPQQTRKRLLQAAFQEIHTHGFQGMRVDEVLRQAGLQKGAFYHHFSSKTELGYAVLDEEIRPMLAAIWTEPLEGMEDPLTGLPKMLANISDKMPPEMLEHGCPLNNLAQEMSAQDDGFHVRIAGIFAAWIEAFTQLFERGKENGYVRTDVDARAAARFVVAALEGCIGVHKVEQSSEQWAACLSQLDIYLHGLKP